MVILPLTASLRGAPLAAVGSVVYPHQAEALWGSGVAGLGAVFGFEGGFDALGRALALADLQQRPGQDTDHVLQEAGAVVVLSLIHI